MNAYVFTRSARNPRALIFVAFWWAVLSVLYFGFNAAPFIVALLGCASLPALFDIGAGATSKLSISESKIEWNSGRRRATLSRSQLKLVRLETRLDISLRMTLLTHQGSKLRLPYECVPPAHEIENALNTHGIAFERSHFALLS